MRLHLISIAVASLCAACAEAAPVYLECPIASEDGKSPVTYAVTLNEEAATATLVLRQTGKTTANMRAAFTPEAVTFAQAGGLSWQYRIDRVNLRMDEVGSFGTATIRRSGTCTIATPPNRKF